MPEQNPSILGLKKSFGYGDRLGLAGPGHIIADLKYDFAGIFAQQSIREMDRTRRTPEEVMTAARLALTEAGYTRPWGADADHLKTLEDVRKTAAAGFTFFTIDPSSHVNNDADNMDEANLRTEIANQESESIYGSINLSELYLDKTYDIGGVESLSFDEETLYRAGVKYGRAIADVEIMAGHIAEACSGRPYEIEVSVDETDSPTSTLEHLFFALELKRRSITVVSLAPRFIGDFEKGIDYKGNIDAFEASLLRHVAIATAQGPYKLSVHSGSDKFSIYPVIGRICGELLHVKTAGTSYLESLRVICRQDTGLFKEITCYCAGRFSTDKATYHISTTDDDIARLGHEPVADLEAVYLDQNIGRQLLHVTFGSVLTEGNRENGQSFKDAILEILDRNQDLHKEVLDIHFSKHLSLLSSG